MGEQTTTSENPKMGKSAEGGSSAYHGTVAFSININMHQDGLLRISVSYDLRDKSHE